MNNARFSRRALLKHMGVSAALLPLISTEKAQGAVAVTADGHPKRFVAVTHGNGVVASSFYPTGTDLSAPLPKILSSMEPYKAKMIVTSGIDYTNIFDTGQQYDGHFSYCSTLTGTRIPVSGSDGTNSSRKATMASIDQLISDNLVKNGVNLKAPLLTLGIKSVGDGCSTSWRAGGQQNAAELDPSRLFTKLFSGTNMPPAQMMTSNLRQQSILDFVKNEFTAFGKRLGTADRAKIEEHLQAVRDLEIRIKNGANVVQPAVSCSGPAQASGSDAKTLAQNMFDIVAVALKCDLTRSVTITMYDDGGGDGNSFPWLGINTDYHAVAHDTSSGGKANKVIIDTWIYSNVANLAKQLNATQEGDKTALDNTVIATFSDMDDGANHYNGKIPITLTGSCGGYFKTNKMVKYSKTPINKLLASICNAMDLKVAGVGDAKYSGTLPELSS